MTDLRNHGIEFESSQEDRTELEPQYYEDGYHTNNEALISVTRHGDKTPEGGLAAEGYLQAIRQGLDRGANMDGSSLRVKGYHAPLERTKHMVDTIVKTEEIMQKDLLKNYDFEKLNSRMRKELDFQPLSKEFIAEYGKQGQNQIDWYLSLGGKFDDESITAEELADRAATVLYREIRMTGRLTDGSKINLENASHSPTLDVFIAKAFEKEIEKNPINPEGQTIVQKMGGGFGTADNFQFQVKTDNKGRLTATLSFRGKDYPVNLEKLKSMSAAYINIDKEFPEVK